MATIQQKTSRGHKYWYIVQSRRVGGKPRPIVLAYLGKAEALLKRLQGLRDRFKLKSYAHGAVALLLQLAGRLDLPAIINRQVKSPRPYLSPKPLRHHLTVGMTLVLAAIGRACRPTSKRGWRDWAQGTSAEYLLRCSLAKVDSQHFWDLMDALPVAAIPEIEAQLLEKVRSLQTLDSATLAYDTTNFFTFVATGNEKCTLAHRGKNKQKRSDLRQVGLALVVTRHGGLPLFHLTYQGHWHDSKVFAKLIQAIPERLVRLRFDPEQHTLIFDRGNNSKANLAAVTAAGLHYVGALTPYQHASLLAEAESHYQPVSVKDQSLDVYRTEKQIWGQKRTILVFVSQRLKAGQLRGIYQTLSKRQAALTALRQALQTSRGALKDRRALEDKIRSLTAGQFLGGLFQWTIREKPNDSFTFDFSINQERLRQLEDELGFRILMTDRHDWETGAIIEAYYGQAAVEQAFKNMKNPYHLAFRPQFHWTDQKIIVHFFLCMLGYLLSALLWNEAQSKTDFSGSIDSLLDRLGGIRLAAVMEKTGVKGKPAISYQLEEMSAADQALLLALQGENLHRQRPLINGVGVYDQ